MLMPGVSGRWLNVIMIKERDIRPWEAMKSKRSVNTKFPEISETLYWCRHNSSMTFSLSCLLDRDWRKFMHCRHIEFFFDRKWGKLGKQHKDYETMGMPMWKLSLSVHEEKWKYSGCFLATLCQFYCCSLGVVWAFMQETWGRGLLNLFSDENGSFFTVSFTMWLLLQN